MKNQPNISVTSPKKRAATRTISPNMREILERRRLTHKREGRLDLLHHPILSSGTTRPGKNAQKKEDLSYNIVVLHTSHHRPPPISDRTFLQPLGGRTKTCLCFAVGTPECSGRIWNFLSSEKCEDCRRNSPSLLISSRLI